MKLEQLVKENYGALMTVKQPLMFIKTDDGWQIKLKPQKKVIYEKDGAYFRKGIPEGMTGIPAIVNHILIKQLNKYVKTLTMEINKFTNPKTKV